MALLILIPVFFALVQMRTNKYIFSPLTTLSCAFLALADAPVMAAALFVSCIGDYFLIHKSSKEWMYLLGIVSFSLGHILFIAHALTQVHLAKEGLFTGAVLAIWFTPYLILRVIRKVPGLLQIPVVLYTIISIASLACAVMTGDVFYILGIAMLVFSDTMIAETDFIGNPKTGWLIMPTYYLCHILVALSALV